ncbi:hypothetical protein FACS1894110_19050 [Spirochaetia bacterium]|nr:hypothetical protein FACS1894110_19050 [Spirochaetia bacterium]
MAKQKKDPLAPAKLNDIDSYTYPEYDRANIPRVGMAQYDMAASPEAKYDYDPHLDPHRVQAEEIDTGRMI